MSNIGLERYLAGEHLKLVRSPVGDRYVIEKMREGGFNVGGEQSGHIIFSDFIHHRRRTDRRAPGACRARRRTPSRERGRAYFEPAPQFLKCPAAPGRTRSDESDLAHQGV